MRRCIIARGEHITQHSVGGYGIRAACNHDDGKRFADTAATAERRRLPCQLAAVNVRRVPVGRVKRAGSHLAIGQWSRVLFQIGDGD